VTEWVRRQSVSDAEWRMERAQAETISCPQPGCTAQVGETCINLINQLPLENQPAHILRIREAQEKPE
jgi:hypothetical protein